MTYRLNPFTGKKDNAGPIYLENGSLYYIHEGRRYKLSVVLDMTQFLLEDASGHLLLEDASGTLATEG